MSDPRVELDDHQDNQEVKATLRKFTPEEMKERERYKQDVQKQLADLRNSVDQSRLENMINNIPGTKSSTSTSDIYQFNLANQGNREGFAFSDPDFQLAVWVGVIEKFERDHPGQEIDSIMVMTTPNTASTRQASRSERTDDPTSTDPRVPLIPGTDFFAPTLKQWIERRQVYGISIHVKKSAASK